ncbi:hypothetical protein [Oceanispirochaeta sp.]|jgi:hypothetical protein|uniref:hypothetical protein n=1 Tax=Oceanispirochaeta sp. TaxID=2035350 RepID=UPI0026210DC2|nr:hypothetical protein [Oceanispirochaeta sp.]MDA3955197.1 hypothetical protein [Oceanispirochaeta sp.]
MPNKYRILISLAFFLLAGCQSHESPIAPGVVIKQDLGDISLTLTLLTEEELLKRHGKSGNPFVAYPGKIPRKDFFVFDTTISSESRKVLFNMQEILLNLDTGVSDNAKSRATLLRTWDFYLKDDNSKAQMKRIIKQNLSDNSFTAAPGEDYRGYIVFLVNTEAAKEGTLLIPVETSDGDKGIIEMPFNFTATDSESENIFNKS